MHHGFLKQSTASQTRIIGPFVDDTDFKSLEPGLTINNTDIKLSKNGAASVDKNSGGGTHIVNGNYAITLDATDTNTVGELHISVSVAGALVVVAKFTVLEEAIYDALIGASAGGFDASGRVDVGSWLGTAVTTSATTAKPEVDVNSISDDAGAANNAELAFDGTGFGFTGCTMPTVTTLTGHTAQTGDNFARLGAPAGASVSADIAAIEAQTDDIGVAGAGLSAVPWNAAWDAEVESEVNDALVALGLDHLIGASVAGTDIVDNSIIAKLVSASATADWDDFVNTTDSLQSIRDKQTDIETDTAEIGAAGAGLTAIPWNASWDAEVESEVNDAIDTAIAELGVGAPTATPTLRTGLMLLYMALRNKLVVQTSGTDALEIHNDAGTKIASKLLTDDGSDYTEAEMA